MYNVPRKAIVSWRKGTLQAVCLLTSLWFAVPSGPRADVELSGAHCRLSTEASGQTVFLDENGRTLITIRGWCLETTGGILELAGSPAQVTYSDIDPATAHIRIVTCLPECNLSLRFQLSPDFPRLVADLEVTYHDSLDLISGGLSYDIAGEPVTLAGPLAISSRDSTRNQVQSWFTPRVLRIRWPDRSPGLIIHGSQEDARGVELVAEDRILYFDGELHETVLKRPDYDSHLEHRWVRRGPGDRDTLRAVFCIDNGEPMPIINPYPGRIPAAFTVIDDADGEDEALLLAAYYGTSDRTAADFGQKGFLGHGLRITRSVFASSALYDVWDQLAADGTEIAVHTVSGGPDTAESTRDGLDPLVQRYGSRHWVDHSVGGNPEDLCYRGSYPRSENPHYILDILEEMDFDYAWVEFNMFQGFDACRDRRELPHFCDAIDDPVIPGQLRVYGRTGGVFFTDYWRAFDRVVTPESLDELIARGGLSLIYTHTCVVNYLGEDVGYLHYSDGTWEIKPEADQLLGLLEERMASGQLWIAPAAEIFDRLIQTQSLQLEKQSTCPDHVWHLHNPGPETASRLGLQMLNTQHAWVNGTNQSLDPDGWFVVEALNPGETVEIRLEPSPLDVTTSAPLRINCGGDALQVGDSLVYQADQTYDPGSGFGHWEGEPFDAYPYLRIGGTEVGDVYLSERIGDYRDRFDLPGGRYIFTLHQAPVLHHGPDLGRFRVLINDLPVTAEMDLARSGPRCYAQDLRFEHVANGEPVHLQAIGSLGQPEVAGIEVRPSPEPWPVVQPPSNVEAWACPGGVFLHWQDDNPPTVARFEVVRRTEPGGEGTLLGRPPLRLLRHWDASASPESTYSYGIVGIDVRGLRSNPVWVEPLAPLPLVVAGLPTYFLDIETDSLLTMNANAHDNIWVAARLGLPDGLEQPVVTRYRGDVSRHFQKKSFKIKCVPSPNTRKRSILNLAWKVDPTGIRENLASLLFVDIGLPAPEATACHLVLNGESQGLYTCLEQLDDDFLDSRGLSAEGVLIKVEDGNMELLDSQAAYARSYERKTGDDTDLMPIIDLVERVNHTSGDNFAEVIWSAVDIPWFLDWYASVVLMANHDVTRENHYWYRPPDQERWLILPWDNDRGFYYMLARHWPLNLGTSGSEPMVPAGPNRLFTRVLEVDAFRWLYAAKLGILTAQILESERTADLVDSLFAHVSPLLRADRMKFTWEDNAAADAAFLELHDFAAARAGFVADHLPALAAQPLDRPRINEVYWSASTSSGWIEIYNGSSSPVASDELLLSNSPVTPPPWSLGSGVIPPGGFRVIGLGHGQGMADTTVAFQPESDDPACIVLFRQTGGESRLLDAVAWPRHLERGVIARQPTEAGRWRVTMVATPALENENAQVTPRPPSDSLRLRPCPGHRGSMLECTLQSEGNVRIDLLDIAGRHRATLYEGRLGAGTTILPGSLGEHMDSPINTGVFYLRMSGSHEAAQRIILIN